MTPFAYKVPDGSVLISAEDFRLLEEYKEARHVQENSQQPNERHPTWRAPYTAVRNGKAWLFTYDAKVGAHVASQLYGSSNYSVEEVARTYAVTQDITYDAPPAVPGTPKAYVMVRDGKVWLQKPYLPPIPLEFSSDVTPQVAACCYAIVFDAELRQ